MMQPRVLATQVLYQVVYKQQHLKLALQSCCPADYPPQDKAWVQHVCYQSLRHHQNLNARWQKFMTKPLKDHLVGCLLTISLAQKFHLDTPDHAVVNEAVKAARKLKKNWATGLINKVLKLATADAGFVAKNESEQYNHPQWWIDLLKKDWPDHWQQILSANNQMPPLWVRSPNPMNPEQGTQYQPLPSAWLLHDKQDSTSEAMLAGAYSVQDAAAQYAAWLLAPQPGELILDACAAPGGKSGHLLEMCSDIKLHVLEKDPARLQLVSQNLKRLNLHAERLVAGDASQPKAWFQGTKYDKILLDVPCSAAGVVRRNPDIKVLRQAEHLKPLTQLQQQILSAIAPLLKVGGTLLYATCSVFRSENERQIKKFLKTHSNYEHQTINIKAAENCLYGQQIITGTDQMDGFYYCQLKRKQ